MYECDICEKEFESSQALGGHKVGAHNDEHKCEYCEKTFKKQHIKKHIESCDYNPKNKNYCKNCGELLVGDSKKKFCSESCSISFSNKNRSHSEETRIKIAESLSEDSYNVKYCENCDELLRSSKKRFCSIKCQKEFKKSNIENSTQTKNNSVKNPNEIGDYSEMYIMTRFIKLGYNVSIPFGDYRYDLIIDGGSDLYKIQIKTSKNYDGSFAFDCSYTKNDIDYFVVFNKANEKIYCVPVEETFKSNMRLRTEDPKNGQTKGINYANEYKIENYF